MLAERDPPTDLARDRLAAFDKPASSLMTRPLITVPADAFVYRAVAQMRRIKIRHLAVLKEDGAIVGAVSAREWICFSCAY
jgi:CBS domain-containing protein